LAFPGFAPTVCQAAAEIFSREFFYGLEGDRRHENMKPFGAGAAGENIAKIRTEVARRGSVPPL
jgi:hypothetical protein